MNRTFAIALVASLMTTAAWADDKVVKIGNMDDLSSLYADLGGHGSTIAAQMAVEDSGLTKKGWTIDVVEADHQNKPDIAANIARKWFDEGKVDLIVSLDNSGTALAVSQVGKEKNRVVIPSGAATSELTNKACNANTIHWAYDTYALANGTGKTVVKSGGDSWFFITADYAFGHTLQADTTAVVEANGGKVLGSVNVPLNTLDFSSFLLQAQSSKAKIIGLANAGGDTINSIKQGAEFGVVQGGQKFAALLFFITDAHSLGLKTAQGLQLTAPFYWDMNDETRAWSKRFEAKMGKKPSFTQAGVYSAMHAYLEAIKASGTKEPLTVMAKLRETPINDFMTKNGKLRIDGRLVRDMYLFEVKKPEESKYPWDYYKLLQTVPGDQAYRPLAETGCPLVQKAEAK